MFLNFFPCVYNAPVKSTPVIVNGGESLSLSFGNGGGSGELYGCPETLRQITHLKMADLTRCRMLGIQNFCHRNVTVLSKPECRWLKWASSITNAVNLSFGGSRYGDFASSSSGAL